MSARVEAPLLWGAAFAVALAACASLPPAVPSSPAATQVSSGAALDAAYAALGAKGGKVFVLDPGRSRIRLYVFRAGRAAALGHDHVLSAPRFIGFVYLPPEGASAGRFDLEFRLDALQFDDPGERAALGGAFAATLPPAAVAGAREHMLGEDNMQADRYPFVRVHSLHLTGNAPKFAVEAEVEMHGQKRTLRLPVDVTGLPGSLVATGAFVLRQSDFGVRPYEVLGGLLAVADEVVVEFTLVGTPTGAPESRR
jgi:hypothetical protein